MSPSVHNKQSVESATKQTVAKIPSKSLPNATTTTTITKQSQTTTIVVDSVENSVVKQDEIPNLELSNSFLNLNIHDTITSNINTSTCPSCHTPNSVNLVKSDVEDLVSNHYTCSSHGNHGCGWKGEHQPNEEHIANHVFSTLGFKPLILN